MTWLRSSGWGFALPFPADGESRPASTYGVSAGVLTIVQGASQPCDHLNGDVAPPGTVDIYFGTIDGAGRLILDVMSEGCVDRGSAFAEPFTRAG